MSDPTTPEPKPAHETSTAGDAASATETTTEIAAVGASDKPADENAPAEKSAAERSAAGKPAVGNKKFWQRGKAAKPADGPKKPWYRRIRGPWMTVTAALVILIALAVLGYVWGLGPLNRLNTARGITPPAKLAGLDRITDQEIRGQLQLDQTRDALSRINDGKQATVEAYGTIDGNRMYVVIALRGKVDIDKTVADSGATPDKVKKIGSSTCVESTGNLPTQCYRGSNTLTVIAQSANEGVAVDQVAPVAEEAFSAMK
ncbi:hypothetical protein AB0E63_25115 [Kribbella sp. NPDC026596]|uniref:hypothetical protein n=1 Tax=Kribbella sp. NPDC026596 TaxID=3155122 RepID=UPI0033C9F7C7